jgi:DME family drug/metabolite transporter
VIIGVVGALFLGEPLDRVRLAALALAVAGTALVVLGGIDPATGLRVDVLGLALALGAAVAQTGLSLVTRSGFRSIPSAHATAGILGGMAVVFWTSSALTGQLEALLIPFRSPDAFALVAYLGLVTAALSTFLFVVGIRLIGPLLGGILSLFDPVVAIVLAAVILGERLTGVGLAGGALVIAAAVVVQRIPVRSNHPGTGVRRDAVGQEPLPPVG